MDILSIFKREELIAGLAITDSKLQLSVLQFNKKKFLQEIKLTSEEILPNGTVKNGVIIDEALFFTALKNLLQKADKITFAILTLPIDNVYSKILSFPKTSR